MLMGVVGREYSEERLNLVTEDAHSALLHLYTLSLAKL